MTTHQSPVNSHQSPITKIGITGQAGFVGTHLYNTLGLQPDKFERIPFEDSYFEDVEKLKSFVAQCDTIVHLAAMNRHNDPEVIYETNIGLVKKLIDALEQTGSKPHVIYSSSIQEDIDNLYGKSKKEGRELLAKWAEKNSAVFTGFVFTNIFGPFGNPYYNSFIATFCHRLTHGETPVIETDKKVPLLYVKDAVQLIINSILEKENIAELRIKPITEKKVTEVLDVLKKYKELYFDKGIIPCLDNSFERDLFNTFVCYIDHKNFFPFHLKLNTDDRGSFVETIKLNSGGQVSFSTTVPGITRGNHFHIRKAERFAVIKGKATIELRRIGTDEVLSFELDGDQPSFVDMPIWYTHNITNIGDEELYTIFWISEHFDADDPDTYFEKV